MVQFGQTWHCVSLGVGTLDALFALDLVSQQSVVKKTTDTRLIHRECLRIKCNLSLEKSEAHTFLLCDFLCFLKFISGARVLDSCIKEPTLREVSIRSKLVGFQTKSTLKFLVHSVGTSVIPFNSKPTSSPNEFGILIT